MTEKSLGATVIASEFNMSSQGVLRQDLTSSTNTETMD